MPGRVVLAMSGGVDSSVAAVLLKRQGYDVVGLFMRTGVHEDTPVADASGSPNHKKGCCSAVDAGDARRVADRLDIPFYALDFGAEFDRVIDYFADEYLSGRTPNPCVVCNTWLKFGKLWSFGKQLDADFIATGHYARIRRNNGSNRRLKRCMGSSHKTDQLSKIAAALVQAGRPIDRRASHDRWQYAAVASPELPRPQVLLRIRDAGSA